jgi:hypothetical protein
VAVKLRRSLTSAETRTPALTLTELTRYLLSESDPGTDSRHGPDRSAAAQFVQTSHVCRLWALSCGGKGDGALKSISSMSRADNGRRGAFPPVFLIRFHAAVLKNLQTCSDICIAAKILL